MRQNAVLLVRISINADPDPAFYLNADPDSNPESQINANPCGSGSWSDFKVTKRRIFTCKQNIGTNDGTKTLLKGRKPGLFVNFNKYPCYWIRIRIPNTDPYSGQPNKCGTGYTTLKKRSSKVMCQLLDSGLTRRM
jgi:hypothetical protein